MKLRSFMRRRGAKPVALALFIVMVVTAFFSAIGVFIAVGSEWYSAKEVPFYESMPCRYQISNLAGSIASSAYYGSKTGYENSEYTNFLYVVRDADGKIIAQNCDGELGIPVLSDEEYMFLTWYAENTSAADYEDSASSAVYSDGDRMPTPTPEPETTYDDDYYYDYIEESVYITAYIRTPMVAHDGIYFAAQIYNLYYGIKGALLPILVISCVAAIALLAMLTAFAGKTDEDGAPVLRRADRIPVDVFTAVAAVLICAVAVADAMIVSYSFRVEHFGLYLPYWFVLAAAAGATAVGAGLIAEFCMSISVRVRAGKWWRSSVIYRVCRRAAGGVKRLLAVLPQVWIVVAGAAVYFVLVAILGLAFGAAAAAVIMIIVSIFALAGLLYTALQADKLLRGGRALASGDLSHTVELQGLFGALLEHGQNLNSISEGMSRAVDERIKSEHFKTELITNVSHDIKTPLTSIISYVDLLKKEQLQNEKAAEYLDVLDRQSARLKKLTEDIVEASKASSGAIKLEMSGVDVSELLRQSVGEYTERIESAGVSIVTAIPEQPLPILADGRQLWRVFENLLSNIRKYSMPGTRAYISAESAAGRTVVTFRNISAVELNISADELLERFVRMDSSRSSEGSGLGLSIAQSLTELMGGTFELFLDGDLFKAVVSFPNKKTPPLEG
jgi:signal transduction histidine kinase